MKKPGGSLITADFHATTVFWVNGVVPAERNITFVLLQPVPQMEYALTLNAAKKKVLTVAGNV